ncbi:hypothetical protein Strvi_4086 [Streptomyces violaceusniger Tu 4113]|uniref:Uncharacterized protein n=1 Tax=Streptomyces violaceusniger (strain Tu 4113) TaxID=653045 RepID=G2P4K5_STRV4|nr:hypothetical protein [Streptomyces violaceusniger]AEM83743.1 hypothetical protein Strvi_4086 [Streptomyces violaceusniger Tu 4113]
MRSITRTPDGIAARPKPAPGETQRRLLARQPPGGGPPGAALQRHRAPVAQPGVVVADVERGADGVGLHERESGIPLRHPFCDTALRPPARPAFFA